MDIMENEATRKLFSWIDLKPTSMKILQFLSVQETPLKAEEIATALDMKTRSVDAAVTKSLVHYGLAKREAKLTENCGLTKKEYNIIFITETGRKFLKSKEV